MRKILDGFKYWVAVSFIVKTAVPGLPMFDPVSERLTVSSGSMMPSPQSGIATVFEVSFALNVTDWVRLI